MKHAISLLTAACALALAACSPSTPLPTDTSAATPPAETPAPAATAETATPETAPTETPVSPTAPTDDACGKAKYAALIGKPATDSAVPPASPAVRHLLPNTQVTMDFRADRLNIEINAEGVITGMKCG